jgi:tRNA uridine 5-carboxymethylaminomethyl modification enzyme
MEKMLNKKADITRLTEELKKFKIDPATANQNLIAVNTAVPKEKMSPINILKRPEIDIAQLKKIDKELLSILEKYDEEVQEQVLINVKYDTYIDRERKLADKITALENFQIRSEFNYDKVKALSAEGREKLKKIKPETLGQASRISGVSASDISVLTIYLGR